jgi:iron complex outermembrane receptor protein/vitamin B12 transporter
MNASRFSRLAAACRPLIVLVLISAMSRPAAAAEASLAGTVVDQLGAAVSGATVTLMQEGRRAADAISDERGEFMFEGLPEGRYHLEIAATGFEPRTSAPVFVGTRGRVTVHVGLQIGGVTQHVVVTAAAAELPQSQIGASVTVIDSALLDALGNTDLLESLRTVPGASVVQTGARGGLTSLFVRGGASNFMKVLVDGVPANDIGGAFDFSDLATAGVERVEVLRGANSVLYGTDALTGVINITTRRGRSRIPEGTLSVDGGNLGTSHTDASIGGAVTRVDYFGELSHLQTDNSVPNNAYRNNTFASRLGVMLGTTTSIGAIVRHVDTSSGAPNAFNYFGIADDSSQKRQTTYASAVAQSQISPRVTGTVRFSVADQDYHFVNPSPTGEPSDPSPFASFLGNTTTITGGNGFTVTGRAILDFSGDYPSAFDSHVTRRLLHAETGVRVTQGFDLAGGVRIENEHGASGATSTTDRTNTGAFVEARGQALGHLYVNGGLGFDHNKIFGDAWTPRVSVAAYVRQPSAREALGDTKLTFNAGKGIKEPNLGQELSSLFVLVPPETRSALGLEPIGPERSRSVDVGIEQGVARGRGRLRLTYFDNKFRDLIEFVSRNVLPQLGVPSGAAAAAGFGAYVNSQSNDAHGVEVSAEAKLGRLKALGSYTFLDATVTESFSSGTLRPAVNPAFPAIKIGQFGPLAGNRPFRRPANSGSLVLAYADRKAQVSLAGYFSGKADDSTGLSDQSFGTSLLLPNQDLDPAFQKFDVSGSYQIHPRLRGYLTVENLFNETFAQAAGFPALPRAARVGVTVRLGGN